MGDHLKRDSYVDRVMADNRHYAQELLAENAKLRGMLLSLGEHTATLKDQLARAQLELDHYRHQGGQLQEQLARAEDDSRRFVERYVQVEKENSNLANLYVASHRLRSTLDRVEIIEIVYEILANLIGCEEAVVFEAEADGTLLKPVSCQGVEWPKPVPLGAGSIGEAAASGKTYVAPREGGTVQGGDAGLTACIPLKLGERLVGALALFGLLPQKRGFEELDHELFDLLATDAAMALYCSTLAGGGPGAGA
jgi:hypothetical protein